MVSARVLWWLVVFALFAASCGEEKIAPTELMLVAGTDLPEVARIRFEIEADGRKETAEADVRDDGAPLTLGVVRDKESSGPLKVSAHGLERGGRDIIHRSALVSFVANKTLVVALHLVRACRLVRCAAGKTCTESGCVSETLEASSLSEWNGTPPSLQSGWDAGSQADADLAADADTPADASGGDAGDTDADAASNFADCGANARNVDLMSDVEHCGMCANACKATGRNTLAKCAAGRCIEECRMLTGDCDGNPSNGCEQSLTQDAHCGACNSPCMNGTSCVFGFCR